MLSVMTVCEVYSMVIYGIQSLIHTVLIYLKMFLAAAQYAGQNANFSSCNNRLVPVSEIQQQRQADKLL